MERGQQPSPGHGQEAYIQDVIDEPRTTSLGSAQHNNSRQHDTIARLPLCSCCAVSRQLAGSWWGGLDGERGGCVKHGADAGTFFHQEYTSESVTKRATLPWRALRAFNVNQRGSLSSLSEQVPVNSSAPFTIPISARESCRIPVSPWCQWQLEAQWSCTDSVSVTALGRIKR